jgi:hypothetical protein
MKCVLCLLSVVSVQFRVERCGMRAGVSSTLSLILHPKPNLNPHPSP